MAPTRVTDSRESLDERLIRAVAERKPHAGETVDVCGRQWDELSVTFTPRRESNVGSAEKRFRELTERAELERLGSELQILCRTICKEAAVDRAQRAKKHQADTHIELPAKKPKGRQTPKVADTDTSYSSVIGRRRFCGARWVECIARRPSLHDRHRQRPCWQQSTSARSNG